MYGEPVKRRLGEASKQQPTRQQTVFNIYFLYISGKEQISSQSTNSSLRKVQISHFAKYRFLISQSTDFSLRKVQIFRFVPFRFAKYNKPVKAKRTPSLKEQAS